MNLFLISGVRRLDYFISLVKLVMIIYLILFLLHFLEETLFLRIDILCRVTVFVQNYLSYTNVSVYDIRD